MRRTLDMFGALMGLTLTAPLMVLIGALIWSTMGLPLLFTQYRSGLGGKAFNIYKFRTMRMLRCSDGYLLPDGQRLTTLGRILRALSLDELPELFNVLKGDMSLVGPRPLLMRYLKRYTAEQDRRHEVKPGLTGWAQVNGRNAIAWVDKFDLDVWYVDNQSLWLDLKIIAMTIKKVLLQEGISAAGEATMAEFNPEITQVDAN